MYHLHPLRHMSYVYPYIFLTKQGNTSTIEAISFDSECGRVFKGAGHKVRRMVLQCINGVSSKPVEGRTKIGQLKDLILTLFGLIFRHIYIYTYIYIFSIVCVFSFNTFIWNLPKLNIHAFGVQNRQVYVWDYNHCMCN